VVLVVDAASGAVVDTLRGFGLPYRMQVTPDGRTVVVTDPMKAQVRAFDVNTRRARWTLDVPADSLVSTAEVARSPSPEGITTSRDGRHVFVTLQGRKPDDRDRHRQREHRAMGADGHVVRRHRFFTDRIEALTRE